MVMDSEMNAKVAQILALQTETLSDSQLPVDEALAQCLAGCEELVESLSERDLFGLIDVITFYSQLLSEFCAQKPVFSEAERLFLQQGNRLFHQLFNACSPETAEALLDYLQHPLWVTPLADEDIEAVRDLLLSDCETLSAFTKPDDLAEINFCALDTSLLELSKVSVEPELTAMIGGQIALVAQQWQQPAEEILPELLEKTLDTLAPIAKAAEMLNLWGIRQLLTGFERNLQIYQEDTSLLTEQNYLLIKTVLELMADYFANISESAVTQSLIGIFTDLEWPYCVTDEEQAYLKQLFNNAQLADKAAIIEAQACTDDIDLTIPEDVDLEFLEMMFSELPILSVEFTETLLKIINEKNLAALSVARRYAHTLKGLASTAGIKGVANLTHALEDILELLAEKSQLPDAVLSDYLLEAADCIDGMNESLLTKTTAPGNALAILQNLHHCFYLLRTGQTIGDIDLPGFQNLEGLNESLSPEKVNSQQTNQDLSGFKNLTGLSETPAHDTEEAAEETFVRISKATLTQLLRIAGETTTLNAQVNEQLQQIKALVKNSRERYRNQQKIIAELEEHVQSQFTLSSVLTQDSNAFDPLELDRYNYLHSSISRLYEAIADSREVDIAMSEHVRQLHEFFATQSTLQKENLNQLLDSRLLPVSSLIPRLQRILRQACRTANKQAQLEIAGADLLIDGQVLNQLADPLMHIIRNAVDHGIEDAHQRFEKAKPEVGSIKISFSRNGEMIQVSCEDDGQGLNLAEIKTTAISKGLINQDAQLSATELEQLILLAGFSTKTEVSQLSGRGIGMDVVFQEIRRLKGNLEIKSAPGLGCRFILSLPSSLLMLKALLVQSGQQILALASYGIKQSVLSLDGQVSVSNDSGWQFTYQGRTYPAFSIENLTGNKPVNYAQLKLFPVLFVNTAEQEQVAVFVSAMLAHKDVLFKEISSYLPPLPGILGLTLLATGQISPLLDLAALIKQQSLMQQIDFNELNFSADYKLPTLLIVDDSLSARKAIAGLLKDSGYLIQTAIDGVEALDKIQRDPPDLVITDYEMPRMDGVELASVLRGREKTAHLPVLMITSRSTDKHRQEAARAGIDYYLTKPWQEGILLDAITQLLSTSSFA
jgi:chemotaxis protein histidine kinase CheA/ActR/RegA family two-component response regulator